MRFLLILFLMFSATAFADVTRDEARAIIDEMVTKQMISAEEAEKAKARLGSMSANDWKDLNKDAEGMASRMPASELKIENNSEATDLSQEQFQAIHNDLAVIAPHYISGK